VPTRNENSGQLQLPDTKHISGWAMLKQGKSTYMRATTAILVYSLKENTVDKLP
jgi:hypothetical protein